MAPFRNHTANLHINSVFLRRKFAKFPILLKDYSIPELIHLLGSRYRDYRQRADMTQKEVAERAGLSVVTVYKFESGAANNLSLGTFLLLLKAVGWIDALDELMPELPPSPYLLKDNDRKVQRIRHKQEKTSKPKIKEL